MGRTPSEIVKEIRANWTKPYFGAVPYMDAMESMDSFKAPFGYDSGESIGLYFLANAGTWRGDVARRIKAEIKALCA